VKGEKRESQSSDFEQKLYEEVAKVEFSNENLCVLEMEEISSQ
jgi:hypothetical protein